VNWSAVLVVEVPPIVDTVTSTGPAASAGDTAVRLVGETNMTLPPERVPKVTVLVDVKPVPVIVTIVPPAVGPFVGDTAVTVGAVT
jgi:hypothetical protein